MASISDLIKKKKELKTVAVKDIEVVDLNRPLILALFAIDVFGKDAADDDIVQVIIGGKNKARFKMFEQCWDEAKASAKSFKKNAKNGQYYADGMLVLRPKTR